MRKRIGLILIVSGLILLLKPSFDFDTIMMGFNYIVAQYWPIGFVFVGALLLWPQKHATRKRKRS